MLMVAATGWTEDWSRFRGPNGSGVPNATGLPVEFGFSIIYPYTQAET
jgi:hypothetical protein